MDRIVVGVNGSRSSRLALEWALNEADEQQAVIEVVHATAGGRAHQDDLHPTQRRDGLHALLRRALAAVAEPNNVKSRLVPGPAAPALVDAARDAIVLVIGASSTAGGGLGSVGHQLAHHAPCPLVIISA